MEEMNDSVAINLGMRCEEEHNPAPVKFALPPCCLFALPPCCLPTLHAEDFCLTRMMHNLPWLAYIHLSFSPSDCAFFVCILELIAVASWHTKQWGNICIVALVFDSSCQVRWNSLPSAEEEKSTTFHFCVLAVSWASLLDESSIHQLILLWAVSNFCSASHSTFACKILVGFSAPGQSGNEHTKWILNAHCKMAFNGLWTT